MPWTPLKMDDKGRRSGILLGFGLFSGRTVSYTEARQLGIYKTLQTEPIRAKVQPPIREQSHKAGVRQFDEIYR